MMGDQRPMPLQVLSRLLWGFPCKNSKMELPDLPL
nr:hypothetical protein Q903MT_gene1587 [Picea sitchensis]